MRPLLLILLLANLLVFAARFDVIRGLVQDTAVHRLPELNAERLRIVRDTSVRTAPVAPPPQAK